jgi:hypothetical protein
MPAEFPQMNDMVKQYLQSRVAAHSAGLAAVDRGEVEPYEAVPAQVLDPKQAWEEAGAVLPHFGLSASKVAPADWPQLVATADAAIALPFAAGHFPQSVRDLQRLASAASAAKLPTETAAPIPVEGMENWLRTVAGQRSVSESLLAAGVLRVARQFDRAEQLLTKLEKGVTESAKSALANERAALLWGRGRHADAANRWDGLPESAPVLFNRGLAALFLGNKSKAVPALSNAIGRIDESSGWHHLGRLYLALAQA